MIGDLIKEKYDYVIDFQGLLKTSFISLFSLAERRVGFAEPREKIAGLLYDMKLKQHSIWDKNFHVVEHNFKLANFFLAEFFFHEFFQGKIPEAYKPKKILRSAKNIPLRKVVLIPCTTWETKFWPKNHWVSIIEKISVEFPAAKFYLTGTLSDKAYLESITHDLLPHNYQKCTLVLDKGLTGLRMFFKDADLILGVDTGPLHLAADALYDSDSAQIIGIYGPTSAKRSGPYSFDYLSYDEIYKTKASHKRTFKKDNGSMDKISPEKLFEKLLSIGFSR
jgi:ADP-heptose:LPS heptosyltransferase